MAKTRSNMAQESSSIEEQFRASLDESGLVSLGHIDRFAAGLRLDQSFRVFAQQRDARLEMASWDHNARQFFRTELGLTVAKRYTHGFPQRDGGRVVVSREARAHGVRSVYGRPRTNDDLHAAEEADIRAGSPGLGLLARRCPMVWLVECQGSADTVALLLAAIMASVLLGPILSPDEQELFGVKTARWKLERADLGLIV